MRDLWAAALLVMTGCGKMAIDGEVIDAAGEPIPNAKVTAAGSTCFAESDATGKFALACQPGKQILVISAKGYTSEEFEFDAPENKRYQSGKHLLVKIPDARGLHLFQGSAYHQMKPGYLKREIKEERGVTERAMCLDTEKSEPNELSQGTHAMFDYEHEPGWLPFRLDEEGCAYRDTKNDKQRWSVQYREKAKYQVKKINEGKSIALLDLKKGDYFIANWKGFFVGADEKDNRYSYTGYWIKIR